MFFDWQMVPRMWKERIIRVLRDDTLQQRPAQIGAVNLTPPLTANCFPVEACPARLDQRAGDHRPEWETNSYRM